MRFSSFSQIAVPSWSRLHWKSLLLLAAISIGLYLSSLRYDFVWDDRLLILDNPYVQEARLLGEGLISDFWKIYEDPTRFRHYYRPTVTLSYFFDYSIWGENPSGYHATNVALHLINVLLFFGACLVLFRSSETALVTAAVFAAHPIHTESVTWISGRTDLLASAFVLGSFLCYLQIAKKAASSRWILASTLLFILALLSKEVAIVLPIALACHLHWQNTEKKNLFYLQAAIAAQAVIGGIYLLIRTAVLEMPLTVDAGRPLWLLFFNLPRILSRYLLKLVAPIELHAHDPTAWALPDQWARVALASVVLLVAVGLITWLGQKDTRARFGGAWALIFLLPVLNAGTFTDVLVAERFLYIPSVGFCWVLGTAYQLAEHSRRTTRAVAITVILLAGLGTWYRNPIWKNELGLFEHMTRSSPHYPLPHILLGDAYQSAGEPDRALQHYQTALELEPQNCKLLNAIAVAQLELGVIRRSGEILDTGFDLVGRALDICPQDDYLHHTLGEYYLRQKNVEAALAEFKNAVSLNPFKVSYYYNIGAILFASGKVGEARPFLEEYARRGPRGEYRDQAIEWLAQ
jgi:hypothetical protein